MDSEKEKNIDIDETKQPDEQTEAAEQNEAAEQPETAEQPKESLEDKLKAAEQKAADNWDKYLRQLAEFENFRKRSNAEKSGMYNNGVRDTVEKLLPVLDNFDRAFASVPDNEKESSVFKGIEMILKQFTEFLTAAGVEEIEAEGQPFDPNIHNAVMHIEDEKCDENVIVEVFQKGYKLGDKVIRPSIVKVAN